MRVIKFRGKRVDNGEWVCGYYKCASGGRHAIEIHNAWQPISHQVNPNTVGQFTGLTDSKGNDIYEGDIISFQDDPAKSVKWDLHYSCWVYWHSDEERYHEDEYFDWLMLKKDDQKYYVNHGNIHDK